MHSGQKQSIVYVNLEKKVKIGAYELCSRALLAPMAGITDASFRKRAAQFGAGWVVSEMVASATLATGHPEMLRKLGRAESLPNNLPHVVQLAGCEEKWMSLGAEMAADVGADLIDINYGCPSKRVTNGYAGSALMQVPDKALLLLDAVSNATSLPITVKMRLGWDDDTLNAASFAKMLVDAGAQMVVVHGRTRQQFYKGSARWNLVRAVTEAVDVPVVVNGDIVDVASAKEALTQSGADAVMMGRGAQGQPWNVGVIGAALDGDRDIRQSIPTGGDLLDFIVAHYEDMLSEYGIDLGVRVARKHLSWYLDANVSNMNSDVRKQMLTNKNPKETIELIRNSLPMYLENAA